MLCASLPALVAGYFVLDHLATNGLVYLRIILGAVIIVSALQLVVPPRKEEKEASRSSFVVFGAFSGIMSGLFSTSGPPLVYHFYRQPLPVAAIRETLVAIFSINALLRLFVVVADGTFPKLVYWPAFFAVITVSIGTHLARHMPLPLSPKKALKLVVFLLLCCLRRLAGAAGHSESPCLELIECCCLLWKPSAVSPRYWRKTSGSAPTTHD